jgi:hypothetical protein
LAGNVGPEADAAGETPAPPVVAVVSWSPDRVRRDVRGYLSQAQYVIDSTGSLSIPSDGSCCFNKPDRGCFPPRYGWPITLLQQLLVITIVLGPLPAAVASMGCERLESAPKLERWIE